MWAVLQPIAILRVSSLIVINVDGLQNYTNKRNVGKQEVSLYPEHFQQNVLVALIEFEVRFTRNRVTPLTEPGQIPFPFQRAETTRGKCTLIPLSCPFRVSGCRAISWIFGSVWTVRLSRHLKVIRQKPNNTTRQANGRCMKYHEIVKMQRIPYYNEWIFSITYTNVWKLSWPGKNQNLPSLENIACFSVTVCALLGFKSTIKNSACVAGGLFIFFPGRRDKIVTRKVGASPHYFVTRPSLPKKIKTASLAGYQKLRYYDLLII